MWNMYVIDTINDVIIIDDEHKKGTFKDIIK